MITNSSANSLFSRRDPNGDPIPWENIRLLYVTRQDWPTYRRLEQEFGLGKTTVQKRGKKEGWNKLREEHHNKITTETEKIIEEKQITDLEKSIRFSNLLRNGCVEAKS